jgi:Nucleotide-diphospho-sugar transferase
MLGQILLRVVLLLLCISTNVSTTFEDRVPKSNSPLFVTYTTGAQDRIDLTLNLLKSLEIHSPLLYANTLIACLDEKACSWCETMTKDPVLWKHRCYCIEDAVNSTESDQYASAQWGAAVIRKVSLITEYVRSNAKMAIFADHDVIVKASLDNIFDDPDYQTPIITMCDFPKVFRPENKMANTGFMLIRNHPEAKRMVELWYSEVFNSKVVVLNDQPPFQEIAKKSEFLPFHRCADEKEGFAMWFHKKKISGSGLNKQYYFQNGNLIKVFHANDITSCAKKVDVLKKLKMWYLDYPHDGTPDPLVVSGAIGI